MNFNELNITEIDKDLSPEERAEWNSIYASYRAGSLLSGTVSGVDSYSVDEDGEKLLAAVVIPYRVKILIPDKLLWNRYDSIPGSISRNILGANIDFIIQEIDRENNICVASRIAATKIKRRKIFGGRSVPKVGERIQCNVLAVGVKMVLVETCGFDLRLKRNELCFSSVEDFRLFYSTGQTLPAIITKVDYKEKTLQVSVRDAKPHPYIGLQKRHPINSRRASVIIGKYKGSIFCKLEDDYDCLCNYSEYQLDEDFEIGDKVVIVIKEYDDDAKRVFGVIVSKWN